MIVQSIVGGACFPPAMGALATSKDSHISMVVPMTGYALSTAFCYYVLFDEKVHHHQGDEEVAVSTEKSEGDQFENVNPSEGADERNVDTFRDSGETVKEEETAKTFEVGDVEER
jgi:hypothetical protein